jgi:8-oxo-(d)GTP phosphatase
MVKLKRTDTLGRHASAETTAFLEDRAIRPGFAQPVGSTQAGHAGSDNRDFHQCETPCGSQNHTDEPPPIKAPWSSVQAGSPEFIRPGSAGAIRRAPMATWAPREGQSFHCREEGTIARRRALMDTLRPAGSDTWNRRSVALSSWPMQASDPGFRRTRANPSVPMEQRSRPTESPFDRLWTGWGTGLLAIVMLLASPAYSDDALLARLQEPGTVLLLRHALAPGTGDPPGFLVDDCSTQRNLSEAGREQTRALGERLRAAGIREARVYSSRWCRCLETASLLGLGPVQPEPVLDSFFQRQAEGPGRTAAARERLRELPLGPPVVMVTHQVNISALTGEFTPSGAGVVIRIAPDGEQEILGVLR